MARRLQKRSAARRNELAANLVQVCIQLARLSLGMLQALEEALILRSLVLALGRQVCNAALKFEVRAAQHINEQFGMFLKLQEN